MSYNQGWNNQQQYAGQPTQQYYNQYNSYGANANVQSSEENKSSNQSDTSQINQKSNDLMLKTSSSGANMPSASVGNSMKPGFNSQYSGYNSNYSQGGQSYSSNQSGYNQQNYNQSQPSYNQNYPDFNQAQQNYNSGQQAYPKNQSYQGNLDPTSQNFNQQSYNKVSRPSPSNYKQQQSYNYNQNQPQSCHLDGDNKSASRFSQVSEPAGGNRGPINTKPDTGYDKPSGGMGFSQQRPDRPSQDSRSRFDQQSADRDVYDSNRERHMGGDRDVPRNMDRGRNRSNFNDRKREGGYPAPDRGGYNSRGWNDRDDNSGRPGDTHVYRNESTAAPISASSDVDTTPGPESDTIFVSGLGQDITELKIAEYFGQIGVIKKDKRSGKAKIYMYMDKESGEPKGECTVTYDDPPSARAAINWFDKKDFNGGVLSVSFAQQRTSTAGTRGRGFGTRGGGNFRGRGRGRGGDRGGRGGFNRGGGYGDRGGGYGDRGSSYGDRGGGYGDKRYDDDHYSGGGRSNYNDFRGGRSGDRGGGRGFGPRGRGGPGKWRGPPRGGGSRPY